MSKRVIPHKNCVQPVGFVYLTAILSASQRAQCQGHNSWRQRTYIIGPGRGRESRVGIKAAHTQGLSCQ